MRLIALCLFLAGCATGTTSFITTADDLRPNAVDDRVSLRVEDTGMKQPPVEATELVRERDRLRLK